ncbi:MAG: restriction endonuclease [Acidobacteria bacterium]|nr:restriction endonuclease [Acidobacteriota bacterium]
MQRKLLPADVKNAIIEVCGRCFWYKQPLFDILARAGIEEDMYLQYEHESKFKIIRQLLADLERSGEDGYLLQRRLLTELCKLRDIPDPEVPDRDAGIKALRRLKETAKNHDLEAKEEHTIVKRRSADADQLVQRARDRDRRLGELKNTFASMASGDDVQGRGYGLEDLLKELFALHEIRYRKSYRVEGEQIDGFFAFGGFDYLVEARWRKDHPTLQDLLAFKGKVDRKIESTRGMIISISSFEDEVVRHLREAGPANLILVDGYDLMLILEGRVSLTDALQAKIEKAAQEGTIYYPLAKLFS